MLVRTAYEPFSITKGDFSVSVFEGLIGLSNLKCGLLRKFLKFSSEEFDLYKIIDDITLCYAVMIQKERFCR
jgi:hypothetical protein